MFSSFARRLTSWYVVAAAGLVFVVLSGVAVGALWSYVRIVNDGIESGARAAAAFAARAAARHETFHDAAIEFENRDKHSGVRVVATLFPPPPAARVRPAGPLPAGHEPSALYSVIDGRVVHGNPRELRVAGSRFGYAVATMAGSRFQRVPFEEGAMFFLADPNAVQNMTLLLAAGVVVISACAGLLAWFAGRYITSQALRPLVDVTHALHRFAARDFAPGPIAVAGKSEFDAIAIAYNAAAAQVAAAFAERETAEQQMRQFVADAGHELRTPLTIVLGYIDLLRRRADEGDERSRKIFGSIAIEGARMRTLIDNLVLLARMEGADRRPTEPFSLRELLEEVVDGRKLLAPALDVELFVEDRPMVIGNRDEIYEAVANVVDNAIKYAPGSPIRIVAAPGEGGLLDVTVADGGPGIRPEDRAGIFERFFRGSLRGEVEGSGLGLAIAKRALERAGGQLRLVCTSERGTTFGLRMRTDPQARIAGTSEPPAGVSSGPAGHR